MIEYEELEFDGYGAKMMRENQPPPFGAEIVASMEAEYADDSLTVTGDGKVHAKVVTFGVSEPDRTLVADWGLNAVIAFLEEAKRRIVHARRSSSDR